MKKTFTNAASPYLNPSSPQSCAVRNSYLLAVLVLCGGILVSVLTGLLPT